MKQNRAGIESGLAYLSVVWLIVFVFCARAGAADPATTATTTKSSSTCVRVVEDRATGLRWRVESQGGGRPNRWVLLEEPSECRPSSGERGMQTSSDALEGAKAARTAVGTSTRSSVRGQLVPVIQPVMQPVIQVGERIVLVQSGAGLEARFPAVALAAAAPGRPLLARLEIGNGDFGKRVGQVVPVTAVAKGLARWDGQLQQNGAGW